MKNSHFHEFLIDLLIQVLATLASDGLEKLINLIS